MDVQLLRCYDKAQDIDALYREILRNCKDTDWYRHTPFNKYRQIDRLVIEEHFDCFAAHTNDDRWMVEKWINLT